MDPQHSLNQLQNYSQQLWRASPAQLLRSRYDMNNLSLAGNLLQGPGSQNWSDRFNGEHVSMLDFPNNSSQS